MTSKVLLTFVLSLSIVIAAIGQQPSPTPPPRQPESDQKPTAPEVDTQDVVKITTNLVQIDAVVTKDGKAVTDLPPRNCLRGFDWCEMARLFLAESRLRS